ncbi:acyl--CoA ligase [Nocardioides sp. JQ2195]|uniref:class I adenylate-forming enzyme family protein n=1 Tax=Nocardioides sp. JQ2195 TaxID=2592334 RepID=UPI00143E1892|nr:class I adenylate-forming enzyme family protein [Nocardioides sp. JQ2195]QIX25531.1 acyl--CoA ligase [Nocardioides sp. JQ2195]
MRLFSNEAADQFVADGWWTGETWSDRFRRNVTAYADRTAIVDALNKREFMGQDPLRLTWQQLDAAVDRTASVLFANGVREGDRVGIQIPNSVELVVTYLAVNRLGAILSPYPMPYRRHEIKQLAEIAGVSSLVTTAGFNGRDLRADITGVADEIGGASVFVWHSDPADATVPLDLAAVLGDGDLDPAYVEHVAGIERHPNDCFLIIFTSGTTGTPKGVPRASGDSMVAAFSLAESPNLTFEDTIINPMPMVNAGSIAGIFLPWLVTGCTLVQHQPFSLEVFAQQIEQEQVAYSVVAPTTLNDMVNGDLFSRYDLSSLRTLGSGSAPINGWVIEKLEKEHGVEVINFFGATEGMQMTADRDTVPDPALRGRSIPLPGSPRFQWRTRLSRETRIKLVDLETGELITEPGVPGELRVKSPNLFSGYLHQVENPFDDEGYYCSGDVFELSTEQPDILVHVDRKKDLIIRGGVNISAAEIESLLTSHPKVAEVAAVGRKDERLGERTCVFVVPRNLEDPPELTELVDHLNSLGVAKFKLPEFLEITPVLPRNPSGKVLKRELRGRINETASAI